MFQNNQPNPIKISLKKPAKLFCDDTFAEDEEKFPELEKLEMSKKRRRAENLKSKDNSTKPKNPKSSAVVAQSSWNVKEVYGDDWENINDDDEILRNLQQSEAIQNMNYVAIPDKILSQISRPEDDDVTAHPVDSALLSLLKVFERELSRFLDAVWNPIHALFCNEAAKFYGLIESPSVFSLFVEDRRDWTTASLRLVKRYFAVTYKTDGNKEQQSEEEEDFDEDAVLLELLVRLHAWLFGNGKDFDFLFKRIVGDILLINYRFATSIKNAPSIDELAEQSPCRIQFLQMMQPFKLDTKTAADSKSDENNFGGRSDSDDDDVNDVDGDTNRVLSAEMMKNRGIQPKKPKRDRNPRVKNRHKFKKFINKVNSTRGRLRKEESSTGSVGYAGETSGIRTKLIKSIRIRD